MQTKKSKLEEQVLTFWKEYLAQGDWRHGWPPYFLHRKYGLPGNEAVSQCSDGPGDHGIDGYYYVEADGILWLYQGKFSDKPSAAANAINNFQKQSIPLLMKMLDRKLDGVVLPGHLKKLHALLLGNNSVITNSSLKAIRFGALVAGLKEEITASAPVEKARETFHESDAVRDLATTLKIRINQIQALILTPEDISGEVTYRPARYTFQVAPDLSTKWITFENNEMMMTHITLRSLVRLYRDRGPALFHKNVRYFKGEKTPPAKHIQQALRDILVHKKVGPEVFTFYHSGIAIACSSASWEEEELVLMDPYILNGCQTITTVSRFLQKNEYAGKIDEVLLEQMHVPTRVVQSTDKDFLSRVTINNNRQNSLPAWSFRANDDLQIDLETRFRDEMHIYYERQEGAYKQNQSEPAFAEDYYNSPSKPIRMQDLAQWMAAALGKPRLAKNKSDIFERDDDYRKIYHPQKSLTVDLRVLVLVWQIGQATGGAIKKLCEEYAKWEWLKKAKFLTVYSLVQVLLQHHHYMSDVWDYSTTTPSRNEFKEMVFRALKTKVRKLMAGAPFSTEHIDLTEFTSKPMVKELKQQLWKQLKIKPTPIWEVKPPRVEE